MTRPSERAQLSFPAEALFSRAGMKGIPYSRPTELTDDAPRFRPPAWRAGSFNYVLDKGDELTYN